MQSTENQFVRFTSLPSWFDKQACVGWFDAGIWLASVAAIRGPPVCTSLRMFMLRHESGWQHQGCVDLDDSNQFLIRNCEEEE